MTHSTSGKALDRLLDPLWQSLDLDAARRLAEFRIDETLQSRIDDLADLCNEGRLTDAERAEYDSYVEGIGLIDVLKAKALQPLSIGVLP